MFEIKRVKAVIDRLRSIAADGKLASKEQETVKVVVEELERAVEAMERESRSQHHRLLVAAVARASWLVLLRYLDCHHGGQ